MRTERAVVLCGAVVAATILARLNFFEIFCRFSAEYERLQLDELLIGALTFSVAGAWLAWRTSRKLTCALAEVRCLQEQAVAAARLDPLTGLPNRRALTDFISHDEDESAAVGALTVLISDLDNFKEVNDTYGHRAGDVVLREIGARLRAIQTDHDGVLIVRLGGDEFACVVRHCRDSDLAERIGRRIQDAARRPIAIGDHELVALSASVGSARLVPGTSIDDTLSAADAAMYTAKRQEGDANPRNAQRGDEPLRTWRRRLVEKASARPFGGKAGAAYAVALSIDRFAAMRATIGHAAGSQLMRELVERLADVGPEIVIDRIAPDMIGLAFEAASPDEALTLVEQIHAVAEGPISVGDHVIDVTVTIGYSGPAGIDDLRVLIEQAQIALEQARTSRHRRALFSKTDYGDPSDRLALMRDMREALANGDITLAYQPKIRVSDNLVDGVEALIRWTNSVRGSISPDDFVRIAEETGDIRDMTEWVLHRAIADQAFLGQAGLQLPVYVNVSARLVGDEVFMRRMLDLIASAEGRIGLEITETAVIDDPQNALANLQMLADAGVPLSIDDYGAGMSSLIYLKQLPVQELKIDRQFITHLAESHRDPLIVRSTIDLAHGLGLKVTAEGVETESALALLRVMGCDLVQGFVFAPALDLDQLIAFCTSARSSVSAAPLAFGSASGF
ncbi:EAL domain-containing protein [Sphingosinicella sp. BN140058]|uniref:EAL domain-containing protein n=1 Tax=Sphingosinicella sp. BN140058 TaxID=1892855 RepID=UPI001012FA93|nr:EAL domain-containing protein [Sphingosinicella sp. BN140058]QAY78124.1 phosphodiesterase [Sphingosinicella sp. BN140058]